MASRHRSSIKEIRRNSLHVKRLVTNEEMVVHSAFLLYFKIERMFFGTTPSIVSQYLFKEIVKHKPQRVFVPFSGNFVVEQLAAKAGVEETHATDISMYSRAIGFGVKNVKHDTVLKATHHEMFPVCAEWMKDPIKKAAVVIFFADVAKSLNKGHVPYYASLLKDATNNELAYLEKILEKLLRFKETTETMEFYGTDAINVINEIKDSNDLVFYDPPVDLGNYESEFRALEECFEFSQPEYTQMTPDVKIDQLNDLSERKIPTYYRNNNPLEKEALEQLKGFKEVYRFNYKYGGNYCVYSNESHSTFVGGFQPVKEEIKNYKLISASDTITAESKVELVQVKTTVSNHYRIMWVKKAQMLDSGWAWLVMVDGKVAGVLQLIDGTKFGSELVVINSDPACPYSKYKKLSKLILMVCCTKEVIDMINDKSMWEHVGFTTRVFTNNPTSMKYRSLFKVATREEDPDSNYKYKIIYQNRDKIYRTKQLALTEWVKKHSRAIEE